jgi:hypothetical protein
MRALDNNMHGTAHVADHFIPPKATMPISTTILFRRAPRLKSDTMYAVKEQVTA